MSLTFDIARRFSKSLRNDRFARFTTIVSTIGVALGCTALIVAISVLRGYEEAIVTTAVKLAAHIEVRDGLGAPISQWKSLASRIRSVDHVQDVRPIVRREALVRSDNGLDGTIVMGTDDVRSIDARATRGRGDSTTWAWIGDILAARLKVGIGDTIIIYTARLSGDAPSPRMRPFIVQGIVSTGMASTDEGLITVPTDVARDLFGFTSDMASALAVTVDETDNTNSTAEALGVVIGHRLWALTFEQRFAAMSSWIALQKEPIPLVLGLISIVAVFTVISSLVIAVVEKTRSIAILQTLGMSRRHISAIFLWNALRIGLTGALLGTITAAAFCFGQSTWEFIRLDGAIYYVSALPVALDVMPFIVVPLTSIVLSILASIVPMILAARISPARALRFS